MSRRRALRPGGWVSCCWVACACFGTRLQRRTYLSNAPDVLIPVLLAESKVLVQPEAHIVAIETVGSEPKVQQVLLERCRNSRLARRRKTSEPDGEAGLLAECVALGAREGRVPGNVAVGDQYTACVRLGLQRVGMAGFGGALTLPFLLSVVGFWVSMRKEIKRK